MTTPKYTNHSNIPLSVAVWLAHDTYDHNDDPYTISATTLLKPLKQIVLAHRVQQAEAVQDIEGLISSRMGTAIHDSIERAWKEGAQEAMRKLGYPESVISRIVINPDPDNIPAGAVPVYMEQREERKIGKWTVTGKFDFVADGVVEDFKSTGVYTVMAGNKTEDYKRQGSIYRWLNPKKIYQPYMNIQFLFTDWSKLRSITEKAKGYPQSRHQEQRIPLLSLEATEIFIQSKLRLIEQLWNAPEEIIPDCTDEELWVDPPVYKYYKNPEKKARSTANFDTFQEANARLAQDGFVGEVVEIRGQVKACRWCPAFSVCKQKDRYIADGRLNLDQGVR